MSCDTSCEQIIIGATCDDQINFGETLDIIFYYKDSLGNPIDLSSATVSIFSSFPSVIKDHSSVTITDAINGEVQMILPRTHSQELKRGLNNRFRLQVIFGTTSDDITPDIWIKIT